MNAIEFVKENGIDSTREKIDFLENRSRNKSEDKAQLLIDLKQIVEAFELVDKFGGFEKANKTLKKAYDNCSSIISIRKIGFECSYSDLQEAINLVEQCQ